VSWWGPWYGGSELVLGYSSDPGPAPELLYTQGVGGVLWGQTATGAVVSYDEGPGSGVETYWMRVMTGSFKSGASPLSWGRVRGAGVRGKVLSDHLQRTRILAEDSEIAVANKITSLETATSVSGNWPNTLASEVRATHQRCSVFKVEIVAFPATAEWSAIDVWLSGTSDRAPSRNRS
jgi:hypothetical protein